MIGIKRSRAYLQSHPKKPLCGMFHHPRLLNLIIVIALALPLSACVGGSLRRDDNAARAKTQMIGMSKEDVLSCMGPPKKKATEGATDVWSYLSTDGQGNSVSDTYKPTGYSHTNSSHNKRFCTINVVMKEGVVTRINFLGPTATNFFNTNDQCGYAVAACVNQ
jgi:outer membrane protein assembly factor BamE (lipoprotein component of BamABCDE complex)